MAVRTVMSVTFVAGNQRYGLSFQATAHFGQGQAPHGRPSGGR